MGAMQPTKTQVHRVRELVDVDTDLRDDLQALVDGSTIEDVARLLSIGRVRVQRYLDGVGHKGDNMAVQMQAASYFELNP